MRKLRNIIGLLVIGIALAMSAPAYCAAKNWETLKSERADSKQIVKEAEIEIRTAKGAIIVTTSRPVQIKVFTILGQLVSNETLPAGTSQLTLGTHGIFIVKTGGLTCKVAL